MAGNIVYFGHADSVPQDIASSLSLEQLGEHQLLMPGLIDCHVHLPQFNVTGCQSETLIEWLDTYIFNEEAKFNDTNYAKEISDLFFQALLESGTTTAAVFLTTHKKAVETAFQSAVSKGNRVIMGLNLMDDNSPDDLVQTTQQALMDTENLCKRWHNQEGGRIQYAWIPRFALTSSEELLEGLGHLRKKYPDVYFHTHLSEQPSEIDAVLEKFPAAKNYTDVYERYGLLGNKSILAHSIHLSDGEMQVLQQNNCLTAHCPGTNFFLKSGRFSLRQVLNHNIHVGLGSDVGAGPQLSILNAMRDAQYTQENWVVPITLLYYLATLGAAKGLMLEDTIGNFIEGKRADFIVLDYSSLQPTSKTTSVDSENPEQILSQLIYRGDDRHVIRTVVQGKKVYDNNSLSSRLALV